MVPMPQGWQGVRRQLTCRACAAVLGNRLVLFFRYLSPEGEIVSNLAAAYNLDAKSWSTVENVAGLDALYCGRAYGSNIRAHAVDDVVFLGTRNDKFRNATFAMQSSERLMGRYWCVDVMYSITPRNAPSN